MAISRNEDPTWGELDLAESYPYRHKAGQQKLFAITDSVLSMGGWAGKSSEKIDKYMKPLLEKIGFSDVEFRVRSNTRLPDMEKRSREYYESNLPS